MAITAVLVTAGCPLPQAEAQQRSPATAAPPPGSPVATTIIGLDSDDRALLVGMPNTGLVRLAPGPGHRDFVPVTGRVPETADPAKLERDVEQLRVTKEAVGAAVTAIAVEALDVGGTLLDEGELRERLPRLRQQWEHLQPWLTPEYVSATRTTSINSLIGAAAAADKAERLARAAEGRMAAFTVLFEIPGQRPAPDASRLERRAVEPRRDNLDVASRDLHAAWRTLNQTREVLAGALAEAGSVPPEVQ